jgi:hypothetical protein
MDRPWSEITLPADRATGRRYPAVVGGGRGVPLPIARIMLSLWPDEVPRPAGKIVNVNIAILMPETVAVEVERRYVEESAGGVDSGLWGRSS